MGVSVTMDPAPGFLEEHLPVPGYEPEKILGRNGCIVYLARHVASGEYAALLVGRFPDSVDALHRMYSRIAHPNIVRVLEVGEVGDQRFCAIEYLDNTLEQRLAESVVDPDDTLEFTASCLSAVAYARESGLLAATLEPRHILMKGQSPKLHCFSLTWEFTRNVGVSAFMAPEEPTVSSRRERLHAQTIDVYRLGAVAYAMLCGDPPVAFKSPRLAEQLHECRNATPRHLADYEVSPPRELCSLVMRCLERAPEKRYQSIGELDDAIETLRSGH